MSHREEDKKTLSWKTLLLWLLLVRSRGKEGVHVLEAAHCGTSACAVALSLLVTNKLPVSCSGLIVSSKSSALFPAYLLRGRMLNAGGTDSSWEPTYLPSL